MQEYLKKSWDLVNVPSALPNNTILIIPNDEMKYIIEIVKSLKDSGLLLKGASETIQTEAKEDFLVYYLVHWVQVY